ncbi:MAG: DUF2235 domain-containing protein [Gammaproteobacteria bacterium]|nr:DUF2235 domain-containing protein [Gammaproteobacteria bacterium]
MLPEEIDAVKAVYKKYGGDKNSYAGAYSNVVKLERYLKTDAHSTEKLVLKSYVEGIGTVDKKGDKFRGYAFGTGATGVEEKVTAGLREAAQEIENNHHDRDAIITTLTFNLFGFSRGAAAARHFIYEVLFSRPIIEQLKELSYQVGEVKIGFTGLFDTVSSHGLSFSNDTDALNLDAISHAQNVVHLTAADEHRKNFSLTDTNSAGSGREIFLPGVHSDIGGSYRDGEGESQAVLWANGAFSAVKKAETERNRLVAANWYQADELTLRHTSHGGVVLNATRETISNRYSRIPLHIMAEFAREPENKISFDDKLYDSEEILPELELAQQEIQAYVGQHQGKGSRSSQAEDWHDNDRSWLRDLRYGYFHFSAKLSFAHAPRYIGGQRRRMTYAG